MTASNERGPYEELSSKKTNRFRRILSQVLATSVKNLLIIDWGLASTFPTILIPALTGNLNQQNRNEFLSIHGSEASWIGSLVYMFQMVGGLSSGFMTDPLGRKRAMILVNIPYAIGWSILYQATEVWQIYVAFALLGLAIGLMEAAVFTYVGEICEPSTRGILVAYSSLSGPLGAVIVYILNMWLPWRSVALVFLAVPLTSAITLCFIPETPQWLLSKHRTKQAQESLCWLRGWTTKETIAHEFNDLKRCSDRSSSCNACIKQDLHCVHPSPTLIEKLAELKRKQNLKPFFIITSLFFLIQFTGAHSMRPYLVGVFKAYESPISSDANVMASGFTEFIALVILICLIRFVGKRRIFLTMSFGIFISSLVISCYGFIYLPSGYNSFDQQYRTFHLKNSNLAYIPTVCLHVWMFCTSLGVAQIPWMFTSELYPFKVRVIVSGISASMNYILGFIGRKVYYNLETTLSIAGTSLVFCVITGIGLILMFFIFPDTEGRTLDEIERHFSDNSKRITDWKIAKNQTDSNGIHPNQQLLLELKDVQIAEK